MPYACPKGCMEPHCPNTAVRAGRCAEHVKAHDAENDRFRKDDPFRAKYNRAAWRNFRLHLLSCNPVCQAIVKNPLTLEMEQCHAAATDIHHLHSPRVREDLFLSPPNVVCLCNHHHRKTLGEPDGQRDPAKYTPTFAGRAMTGGIKQVN